MSNEASISQNPKQSAAQAGWYEDPQNPGTRRYWDGESWAPTGARQWRPLPGPDTSQTAVWAMISGLACFLLGPLAAIPALILGIMGLREIQAKPGLKGKGYALTGTIIGGLVFSMFSIAIVGTLAGI